MSTTLDGIKSAHRIITPTCRKNQGVGGAFDQAAAELRRAYAHYATAKGNEDVNWHLVLVRHDPAEVEVAAISHPRSSRPEAGSASRGGGAARTDPAWCAEACRCGHKRSEHIAFAGGCNDCPCSHFTKADS